MPDPKERGREFEEEFAKKLGGELVPGSGNQWYAKLDVEGIGSVRWSLKHTDRRTHEFAMSDFEEALESVNAPGGEGGDTIAAMGLGMQGGVLVVMDLDDFARLFTEERKLARQSKAEAREARASKTALERLMEDEREEGPLAD